VLLEDGSGKVAVALPEKKLNSCLKQGRYFQFSLAGFNASNVLDDSDYLLIFY